MTECFECGDNISQYKIWNGKPLCENCSTTCNICNKAINLVDEQTEDLNGKAAHAECFDQEYVRCRVCDEPVKKDQAIEDVDGNYYCASDEPKYNRLNKEVDQILRQENTFAYYGVDPKVIRGNILPVLNAAKSKFNNILDEKSINFILSRLQTQEAKAAFKAHIKKIEKISEIISHFENNASFKEEFKTKFPRFKGYQALPGKFTLLPTSNEHEGITVGFVPTSQTFAFLSNFIDNPFELFDSFRELGHYNAFGYVRFTEYDNKIIVDNLQSDYDEDGLGLDSPAEKKQEMINILDKQTAYLQNGNTDFQSLSVSPFNYRYNKLFLQASPNRELTKKNLYQINSTDNPNKRELMTQLIKLNEDTLKNYDEYVKKIKKILSFIKKSWAPQLILFVRSIGEKVGKPVYLTSSAMQLEKWQEASPPTERLKSIYDKLPEQFDFPSENVELEPESLPKNTYSVRRISMTARKYLNITNN